MATKKSADSLKLKNIIHRAVTLIATTTDSLEYGEFSPMAHYADVAHTVVEISGLKDKNVLNVLIASAYLHDFVEDVKSNGFYDLQVAFGKDLANIVWAVSGFGRNRSERLADKFAKVQKTPAAFLVLIADRISNLRCAINAGDKQKIAMYLDGHEELDRLVSQFFGSDAIRVNTGIGAGKLELNSDVIDDATVRSWYNAYLDIALPAVAARAKRKAREAKKSSK